MKTGLIISVISFLLLLIGVVAVLSTSLTAINILVFIGFSLIVGGIAASAVIRGYLPMFILFIIGIAIGYIEMFRAFMNTKTGWGDLAGLFSLFIWVMIGFIGGVSAQLIFHLYRKSK
ncbi:hypothetical protein [Bacillus sp. FJAT-50079]|uniref:hypothetical protein n=1 Tax=Bacillus sp. FJAT-50079 TaxID=2833577 RepID=UPI001BCA3D62|nr:hypothetical protein [Bacillus sp. FJAT-50079]MBS4209139.1 hypothetical protein [Bacillus sp. FJAT-50079]